MPAADAPMPTNAGPFDTPEEAALSGWLSTPSAHARVIAVGATDNFDGVYVTVQIDGHPGYDLNTSACVRDPDGKWWDG